MESQSSAAAVDGDHHAVHDDHHDVKPSREAAVLASELLSRLDPLRGGHRDDYRTATPVQVVLAKAKHNIDLRLADAALLAALDRMS